MLGIFYFYKYFFILLGKLLWIIFKGVMKLFHVDVDVLLDKWIPCRVENVDDEELDYEEEEVEEEVEDECPFCQLIKLGKDMNLLIDHVEMCPDETALVRVVDEEGYTPLYRRKVRKDKRGGRFIVFGGEHLYLDDKKTQPIIYRKEVS